MTSRATSLFRLAVVLSGAVAACGGATTGPTEETTTVTTTTTGTAGSLGAAIALGTYASCSEGVLSPSPSSFPSGGGFEPGGQLVLAQDDAGALSATYTYLQELPSRIELTPSASGTATVVGAESWVTSPNGVMCQGYTGGTTYSDATLTPIAGTAIESAGTLFIALQGTLAAEDDLCGATPVQGSVWLICGGGPDDGGGSPASSSPVAALPVGGYKCTSQLATATGNATGGGNGTLHVTQDGANVTAVYAGDSSVSGTLALNATTATTAVVAAGQALTMSCLGTTTTTTPSPLPVTAGALAVNGGTLFLSFAGTTGASSACPGVQTAGTLICTP